MDTSSQLYTEGDALWLDDNATLWRYVDSDTLFQYPRGSIYMSSIATLYKTDPFEGICPWPVAHINKAMAGRFGHKYTTVKSWINDNLCSKSQRDFIKLNSKNDKCKSQTYQEHYFRFLQHTRFAWCWFCAGREDALMWQSYARKGVAIRATVGRLKNALTQTDREFVFGKMCYCPVSESAVFSTDRQLDYLINQPYFMKRYEYHGESEVRFVTAGPQVSTGSGIVLKLARMKPSDWIDEIRLSPNFTKDEFWMLKQGVARRSAGIKCKQSDLCSRAEDEDEDLEEFRDAITRADEENRERGWRDGSDGIPPLLKHIAIPRDV
jgi:hypothetical protein